MELTAHIVGPVSAMAQSLTFAEPNCHRYTAAGRRSLLTHRMQELRMLTSPTAYLGPLVPVGIAR